MLQSVIAFATRPKIGSASKPISVHATARFQPPPGRVTATRQVRYDRRATIEVSAPICAHRREFASSGPGEPRSIAHAAIRGRPALIVTFARPTIGRSEPISRTRSVISDTRLQGLYRLVATT